MQKCIATVSSDLHLDSQGATLSYVLRVKLSYKDRRANGGFFMSRKRLNASPVNSWFRKKSNPMKGIGMLKPITIHRNVQGVVHRAAGEQNGHTAWTKIIK